MVSYKAKTETDSV